MYLQTYWRSSQVSISQYSLPAPVPAMNVVMGVSDWDFLCPTGMEPGPDEDISKRPSLEEFDGELAIFQVGQKAIVLQPLPFTTSPL